MKTAKRYFIIEPAKFKLDGGAMYGIIPKPLWQKKSPPDEHNRIDLALRLLLIQCEHQGTQRNIIVDTGIGDYHPDKFNNMFDVQGTDKPLQAALSDVGLATGDITDLVISHLHFDHVGGLTELDQNDQHRVVFENAHIHLHKKHYQYSLNPTQRDTGSFHSHIYKDVIEKADAEDKVHWLNEEEGDLFPELGIKYICSYGHTPHLMHLYDEHVFYLTDLIPTSHHVKVPWVMGYDIEPGRTTVYKEQILEFIFKNKLNVIYEHDPQFCSSQIHLNDKKQYEPTGFQDALEKGGYEINLH